MSFINLHAHSEGSLLDGAGSPFQRAERAAELNQSALSLTDHGNLIMAPQHIAACQNNNIKQILGIEAYFRPDRNLKTPENKKAYHFLLLAKNEQGWKNLIKLSTEAYQTGFYYKPCMDWELLEKYKEGIICSSACISGYLPSLIQKGNDFDVENCLEKYWDIFGEDFYLEIMPHDVPAQKIVNNKLVALSNKHNIPIVATNDSHYPYKDWRDTQDILLMIATGQTRAKRVRKREAGEDVYEIDVPLHMFSEDEMYEMFATYHPDLSKNIVQSSIDESAKIADKIEPIEINKSLKLPKESESEQEAFDLLKVWCSEGMKRIDKVEDPIYQDRLSHEIKTLKDMGVVDYFVIVGKMVRWARSQGIRISSGRGSAAGSLVCYLIQITTVDPIAHDLLFERFLNPNRKGLPDIDLDFEDQRREEVKEWLAGEYGEDRVCDIVAFQTYGPKGALKDVGRVLDIPLAETTIASDAIPEATDVGGAANVPPLSALIDQYGVIKSYADKYPEAWKHATRIEGHMKTISKHAGGVVVTDKPITEYMPLIQGKTGIVTSWSDSAKFEVISMMNMLKIDVLSLKGLSRQGSVISSIEKRYNKKLNLDDLEVARNPEAVDQDVMELFRKGQTLGVFQFGGSTGITSFLKHVKPDRFEDLIAVNALYRPGPLEGGDAFRYGDLKQGKEDIEYWHDSVIPFLEKTYGIMVYQEQMQQIAQVLGDFSPAEADDMRKATSKIYRMGKSEAKEFMSQYQEQWVKGCLNHGLSEQEAISVWERMLAFGAYSFNRSHSTSYSLMSYQDAYLKKKYPLDFYASLLTYDNKQDVIVREARGAGIPINLPDINKSEREFTIAEDELFYGLLRVKYVGENTVREIVEKRPYESFEDFKEKVTAQRCNKQAIEYLTAAGAFDCFGLRDDIDLEGKREGEIESLGVALSGSGESSKYSDIIEDRITTEDRFNLINEGTTLTIAGEIASIKHHTIKSGFNKGKKMAYIGVSYKDNNWDCTVFKKQYDKYIHLLKDGNIIMCRGKKGEREEVIVTEMIEVKKLAEALKKENV